MSKVADKENQSNPPDFNYTKSLGFKSTGKDRLSINSSTTYKLHKEMCHDEAVR